MFYANCSTHHQTASHSVCSALISLEKNTKHGKTLEMPISRDLCSGWVLVIPQGKGGVKTEKNLQSCTSHQDTNLYLQQYNKTTYLQTTFLTSNNLLVVKSNPDISQIFFLQRQNSVFAIHSEARSRKITRMLDLLILITTSTTKTDQAKDLYFEPCQYNVMTDDANLYLM